MTQESRKAAAGQSGDLPIDRLAAKIKGPKAGDQNSLEALRVQGTGSAPLFHPRTRSDALRAAQELNDAATRCRRAARTHPGATGLTLDRLAVHYAGLAARFFTQADALPEMAVRA